MRRPLIGSLVVAVALAAMPAASGVAAADVVAGAGAGAGGATDTPAEVDHSGTWIGTVEGTDVGIAVISDGKVVRAYGCNGAAVSAWFEGELVGNSFSISAPDGSTIAGAVTDGVVSGVFNSTDGSGSGAFTASPPTGGGGVFRSYFIGPDAAAVFIRWIVFDDGSQRGNAETTTPAGTQTTPAPPLDVAAAQTQATAPVGPVGDPAPVIQLTPQSITNPVPTTQLAGAPPPIPPPAPPAVQPLAVTGKVTPAKAEVNAPVRYQLTLTNPNKQPLTGAGVRVGLPPGLAVRANTDRTTCKGTFAAFPPGTSKPGAPHVVVSAVALAAGASCTADVDLVAAAPVAADIVSDAPTATGAPPGKPARVTVVVGSSAAAPPSTPTTTTTAPRAATTTTTAPRATASGSGVPSPPRNVTARALPFDPLDGPKGGRVEVAFDTPASTGGSDIINFAVLCFSFPFGERSDGPSAGTRSSPITLSGFEPGVEFQCAVEALNRAGAQSPEGTSNLFTVQAPPKLSAPRNVRARVLGFDPDSGGLVEVTFDPPARDGGTDVISFGVQCFSFPFGERSPGPFNGEPSSPVMLTGFEVDVEYQCAVDAFNRAGDQSPEAISNAVTVSDPTSISAPRNVRARALPFDPANGTNGGQVEVTFDPPTRNGGSRITGFFVFCRSELGNVGDGSGPSSPRLVTGLDVDVTYVCGVTAVNEAGGIGPEAFSEEVTVPGPLKLSAPRNVRARALPFDPVDGPKSGRVEVTFDTPTGTGGSDVINFAVVCFSFPFGERSDGPSGGTRSSPLTLTGFEPDVEYQCAIEALNRAGAVSPEAISNTVTILGPAKITAPRNVTARALPYDPLRGPNGGLVEVTFDPPARTGGADVNFFGVECFSFPFGFRSTGPVKGDESSPMTLLGFEPEVEYECAVVAFNRAGDQSPEGVSNRVTVRDPEAISAPRNVKARALPLGPTDGPKSGQAEVTFDPPARIGGADITGHFVFCESQTDPDNVRDGSGKSSPRIVTGLDVDVAYVCAVSAVSADRVGQVGVSNSVTVRGPPKLSPPRNVEARALPLGPGDGPRDGRAELTFDPPQQGEAQVSSYEVQCFSFPFGERSDGPIADGVGSPVIVVGLSVDVEYECSIAAFNKQIVRGFEVVANPVTVRGAQTPSPPRNVRVRALSPRAGDGQKDGRVEVSFDTPANTGGSDIVNFGIECSFFPFGVASPGPVASGPSSPLPLSGFTVDTDYECSVFAVNRHGLISPPAAVDVTVRGGTALVATPAEGTSPLSVTFDLVHAPEKITRWELDFGDGSPKVRGEGPFRAVPHTYVSKSDQAVTLTAALRLTPEGGDTSLLTTQVPVHPTGTGFTFEGVPSPPTVRRGDQGTVAIVVRNPNATPLPAPLTITVLSSAGAVFVPGGWDCSPEGFCVLDRGLEGFATAPLVEARFTAPNDAPATIDMDFEVIAGNGATIARTVRVPVVGVVANAGPDQTVEAVTPSPDGSLVPTQVLLDAIESVGLEGKNVSFSWRQVRGTPRVDLDTKIDPSGRVVTFDAPPVDGDTRLEFELTATEGRNVSTDRVAVTVVPRNQPPVLRKIDVKGMPTATLDSGVVVPRGEGTLTLTRDASDPDGDRLTTTWRVLSSRVPNGNATGDSFSLDWPVEGVAQVIVEATVSDPRGAVDTATVALGEAPDPLGLEVNAPARVAAGERVTARANPSRTSGVEVRWNVVSGTPPAGFPKNARAIDFTAPDVSATEVVVLEVTATETATGVTANRQVAFEVQGEGELSVSAPPAVAVGRGDSVSVEATIDGPASPTLQWTQTFGPDVGLQDATTRTVGFEAPDAVTTIGLRLVASAGASTASTNTVVTVGGAAAAPASGCGEGSAYQQFADGGPVVLAGGLAVITGFDAQGTNADCDEATLDGVDVILVNGLVVGDDLGGTVDQDTVRLSEGSVRLPSSFQLPDIDLGGAPLEIEFEGQGGGAPGAPAGGGDPCISWDAAFSSARFPFVPLPPGFSGAGAAISLTCTSASITAEAAAGGATFAVDAELTSDGGADATATLTNVPALGGTASGTGSISVAPGGAATYDLSATITSPQLPIPGLTLDSATARLTPAGLTIAAQGALGQGSAALEVSMEGAFDESGLSLAIEASNNDPWEVGPGLSVEAANLVGSVDIDAAGAATVDLRLSVGGNWEPVPGLRVTGLSLQVSNTEVPPDCAIPAGGVWVRVGGQGAIDINGVDPVVLEIEACLGVPTGGGAPPFSLRSTVGGPEWQVAPGVVIRDVGISVTLVDGDITLEAFGSARLLGLDLTARVLFLVIGGGPPTVVVDASGDLSGLGIPIPSAHVVFASAAVSDFELESGLTLDLPQGITGVGTIDLGQPIADLLNEAFSPPTPILPTVTVTISFGATIEIKAAINLGGDGATLFMGCPEGGTACDPTAPTTTRLALTSAFIRLVLGGAGGFSIGFGADGTLNLPPAEEGGPASPLDLHVEASIQPPARVGLVMFFEGALQNAMGLQGLTLSNLGIQGSIDFSTTPVPLVTIGITGQVDRVPNQLASVLGLTNNGEPMRFTLNVDPLAPILELTLGVDNGQIVARPLAAVGQADALEVDFASVVVAPLGGTVGPVTYSPGVSAGFRANILGVPVNVNASVDIAAAHLNGTVEVGTLTVGGVTFEDTTILLDITPQRFRQTVCGGVHIGTTTLQGLLHVQAGAGGGGPATCGDVSLDGGGSGAGLRARFRLHAASLPVGPVNVQELTVDAQANLDALSGSFNATLNVTGEVAVLANTLALEGTVRFGPSGIQELHAKALGNVNVAGVQLTGDGTCPFAQTTAVGTRITRGAGRSAPTGGSASGACVQLDHAPETSTPFRFGLKGKLIAAGSTASVTGSIDASRANLSGTLNVPTLGNLVIGGTLVFGTGGTIANATGANVSATSGDWRVSGQFESSKTLAGGVSARWRFAAGRVSASAFVRGSADVAIGGATVQLAGSFTASSSGSLTYSLTGSSSGAVQGATVGLGLTGAGALNVLHSAIRAGVFNFPGLSPIGGRASDENFPERMRGRLHFDASYDLAVTLTQGGLDIDEADIAAKVVYGERFDRDGNGEFDEEAASKRNTLVNFNLDASGIDEFFEMAVADAASRTQPPEFCFELFGEPFGSC